MKTRSIRIVLFLFLFLAWITTTTALPQVFATPAHNAITLTLDRETVNYLFNIPKMHAAECLRFKWDVQTDSSYTGQISVLQFSHDGKEWRNLANAAVESNGKTSRNQPVDSGWAISGRNYLRIVIGNEVSNTVVLRVNVGFGYHVVAWLIVFISVLLALWCTWKRMRIRKPRALGKLQSYLRAQVSGREKIIFLTFGLLIRVLLAPWTEQRFDNYVSRLWCSLVYGYDLYPFEPRIPPDYPPVLRYSYPPVSFFVTSFLFLIWRAITGFEFLGNPASLWNQWVVTGNIFESYRSFVPPALPLLDLFFKLPNILADIGIGYLLIDLAQDTRCKKAILFLWILNPYTIQISSIWGMFDPLCTFFAFYSIYLLWKRKFFLSAMFLSLGIATKMYPMFFLIPILIYVYKDQGLRKSIKYLTISLSVGVPLFCSFLLFPGGLEFVHRLFTFKASPDWYGKNLIRGLTWTQLLTLYQWEKNQPVFPLIFIPVFLGLNYTFWRRKNDFDSLVTCLVSVLLLTYLSYTVVNPQYIFWALPFMLYLVIKGRFSKKLYTIFSSIPLIYMYGSHNPLYFISPVIVWEEHNYPPWSDAIQQLWPIIFNDLTIRFLSICMFPIISLLSLLLLMKSSTRRGLRSLIHVEGNLSAKERHQRRSGLILNSWKEKLGIETGQDLLILSVVMGIAVTVLITLAFASLGYIVPFPY